MRIGLRPNKPNLGFAVRRDNGSIRARTSGLGLAKKDENAEEWEEDEPSRADGEGPIPKSSSAEDETVDDKKRAD